MQKWYDKLRASAGRLKLNLLAVMLREIFSWLCYKTFQQTDAAHVSKYSKLIIVSDDLDATRAICAHTNLGGARYFSSFYCGKHVAGVVPCTLKSRYNPPFTSTGLADKYAQADASWKHALAHPLIIFRTWNFSAPPQFTRRRNEFSYFFSHHATWSTHVSFSVRQSPFVFIR